MWPTPPTAGDRRDRPDGAGHIIDQSAIDVAPVAGPGTVDALHACASSLRLVAAVGGAVGCGRIRVGAGLNGVDAQVARAVPGEADRVATVATSADVPGAVVTGKATWAGACGVRSGHAVHVWTLAGLDAGSAGATVGVA
jgi:hypothetical protein